MEKTAIAEGVNAIIPEGFHLMDEDEVFMFFENRKQRGIRSDERNMIVSVLNAKTGFIGSLLTNEKAVLNGVLSTAKKRLKDYEEIEKMQTTIGGKKAAGVSYTCTATRSGEPKYGEIFVVKHDKTFSVIQYYSAKELKDSNAEVYKQILDSIEF